MRYSLHNTQGHRIGEANTAQAIVNIAYSGTWSYDTNPDAVWPCCVYTADPLTMGLIGTPYKLRSEAMKACKTIAA
jgi:hypothetical protein